MILIFFYFFYFIEYILKEFNVILSFNEMSIHLFSICSSFDFNR